MAARRTRGENSSASWLAALQAQGLKVRSARDALQVKGWLDTGNYALNWAISGRLLRGYPLGHTVEIFGDPSTGKSFLAARAMAMAQATGGVTMLDDVEGAYNEAHTRALGVDTARLAYRRSRTVKEHLATTMAFIGAMRAMRHPGPGVLVLDSYAQLSTEHELESQLDKRDMSKAAALKSFFRIAGGDLVDLPVVHLGTNHTIAAIGNKFQARTTPGGGGPKFMASVRLDMRATSKIRAQAGYAGVICRVVVDKNRVCAPWKEVRLAIPFEEPISRSSGLIPLLVELGVLTERGQFLLYRGERLGRAYKAKDRFIDADAVAERMLDQYPEILEETDAALEQGTATWRGAHADKTAEEAVDDEHDTEEEV